MIYTYTNITPKIALKWYVFTFSVNTFFALFFWSLSKKYPFGYHFIFSHCQGFSILNFGAFAQIILKNATPRIRLLTIFVFSSAGSIAGKVLAPLIIGIRSLNHQDSIFLFVLNMMIVAIIIGFLYYWEGITVTNSSIQEERKKRLDIEKKIAQTQLKLIQTQIDPRFLFNTLHRILQLLDSEPETAKSMQLSLIRYLRLSLSKFRNETHAVSQETAMIHAYLDLLIAGQKNKMHYKICIPDNLNSMTIPTMLVHSLVETVASLEKEQAGDASDFITVSGRGTAPDCGLK
jgi:sensor histidine kinase YesM